MISILDCVVLEGIPSPTLKLRSMVTVRRCCIVISEDRIVLNLAWMMMNVGWNNMQRALGVTHRMMVDVRGDLLLLMFIVALLIVI